MNFKIAHNNEPRDIGSGQRLAPYASDWRRARGRLIEESSAQNRSPFQRDRDRILHSDAFRRLQYKTQVFTNSRVGDHFRTRLTHTLEVAQLTRTLCRTFNLDEDLGEAIALGHDLGHPPFGHEGEEALNACMKDFGGFWHNAQTMRIMRHLERPYAAFDGLNLTWETLEGTATHNGPMFGGKHTEYMDDPLFADLEPHKWCSVEGQMAATCDDIAYNHHDMEDGIRSGSITIEQIREISAFERVYQEVIAYYPNIDHMRLVREVKRRMIDRAIRDVLQETRSRLEKYKPKDVEEVRELSEPVVAFSKRAEKENEELYKFLFNNLYKHHEQNRMGFRARRVISDLFGAFYNCTKTLPEETQLLLPKDGNDAEKARVICDYLACKTDRSIMAEHALMFGDANYLGY